mgnify:CR=1 FL=1
MSDEKVDDRIHIVPRGPDNLGATCAACDRCWNLGAHVSLRDIKRETRHQCAATTAKQREWPEPEEPSTMTDPSSVRKAIIEARSRS